MCRKDVYLSYASGTDFRTRHIQFAGQMIRVVISFTGMEEEEVWDILARAVQIAFSMGMQASMQSLSNDICCQRQETGEGCTRMHSPTHPHCLIFAHWSAVPATEVWNIN